MSLHQLKLLAIIHCKSLEIEAFIQEHQAKSPILDSPMDQNDIPRIDKITDQTKSSLEKVPSPSVLQYFDSSKDFKLARTLEGSHSEDLPDPDLAERYTK